MSRPKGSKNKPKNIDTIDPRIEQEPSQVIKRGRGRPRKIQSQDIIKVESQEPILTNINEKDIKQEIRQLKKLKLQCRAGSKERIDLYRQIKDLKDKLTAQNKPEPEKDNLISEILKVDILLGKLEIDLKKFTISELKKHLDIITKKVRL